MVTSSGQPHGRIESSTGAGCGVADAPGPRTHAARARGQIESAAQNIEFFFRIYYTRPTAAVIRLHAPVPLGGSNQSLRGHLKISSAGGPPIRGRMLQPRAFPFLEEAVRHRCGANSVTPAVCLPRTPCLAPLWHHRRGPRMKPDHGSRGQNGKKIRFSHRSRRIGPPSPRRARADAPRASVLGIR